MGTDHGEGDYSGPGDDDTDRRQRLQEKNRKAQQAFRSRQKGKISELSDKCAQLEAKFTQQEARLQEVQHDNAVMQTALYSQSQQLEARTTELAGICKKHSAHLWKPSRSLQFDPSEDIALKYPVTADDGKAEHLLIRSSELLDGCAVNRMKQLYKTEWIPQLRRLHSEYLDLQDQANDPECSSREQVSDAMKSISDQVGIIQQTMIECNVKAMRAQPSKVRLVSTDVQHNCNARLDHTETMNFAEKAFAAMDMSNEEQERSCEYYEKYLCEMALLQVQRRNMLDQLQDCYRCDKQAWLSKLESEQLQMKDALAAVGAIEALHMMLRKENDLYCDLVACIHLDVWRPVTFLKYMGTASPGRGDLLSVLSIIRQHLRHNESAVSLTSAFIVQALSGESNLPQGGQANPSHRHTPQLIRSPPPHSSGPSLTPNNPSSRHQFSPPNDALLDNGSNPNAPPSGPVLEAITAGNPERFAAAAVALQQDMAHSNSFASTQDARQVLELEGNMTGGDNKRKLGMLDALSWERASKQQDVQKYNNNHNYAADDGMTGMNEGFNNNLAGNAAIPLTWRNLSLNHLSDSGVLKNGLGGFQAGNTGIGSETLATIAGLRHLSEQQQQGLPQLHGDMHDMSNPSMSISQLLQCDAYSDMLNKRNPGSGQLMTTGGDRTISPDLLNGFAPSVQDILRSQNGGRGTTYESITQLLAASDNRNGSAQLAAQLLAIQQRNNFSPANMGGLQRDTLTCLSEHLDAQGYTGGSSARNTPSTTPLNTSLRTGPGSRKTPLQLHHDYTSFFGEDDLSRPKLT